MNFKDPKRKKLYHISWHRGTKESDMIFGRFADQYLAGMNDQELSEYEALMNVMDADLFDWVVKGKEPPEEYNTALLQKIISFLNDSSLYT